MSFNNLIESEPFDIRFIQTPEFNQPFFGHPVTGDGWSEDGRFPDLLDFCKVSFHRRIIRSHFLKCILLLLQCHVFLLRLDVVVIMTEYKCHTFLYLHPKISIGPTTPFQPSLQKYSISDTVSCVAMTFICVCNQNPIQM